MKSKYRGEGRRRLHLRVLEEFWIGGPVSTSRFDVDDALPRTQPEELEVFRDSDPFDQISGGQESGLLLRTDFSTEDAWQAFCSKLQDSEREFNEALQSDASPDQMEAEDSDSDDGTSDMESIPTPLIKVVNPVSTEHRLIFDNMSNLTALRLFNDVNIRLSPSPPPGTVQINPPNRLIDQAGWQEIYSGQNIWIYDAISNTDQCVRLVSQQGNMYGTATGDSWRARGTHIYELQFNITYLGMEIDFGGLDRWDYGERRRNLDEANRPIT
ncbi:hypothetical protein L208DRAFT_1363289 [Tricholoma matsutake]|nr:hypothetical protein L208DRAFT_1363289 [Tricholoma matsutake 945]